MKFSISSSVLSKQLSAISGAIVNNPIVPILENFLFEIHNKQLTVTASDLQVSIKTALVVETQENVSIAIPARILLETLRNLPEQPVTFSVNESTHSIEISSENGRYRLAGENAADFPELKMPDEYATVEMPTKALKKAVNQTIIATSNDELRPAMNGVYMNFSESGATFVATDGHRLVRHKRSDISVTTQNPFIVPRKTLTLLNSLLPSEAESIKISFSANIVSFQLSNILMVSRLIDERYPDYENVIPINNPKQLTISRLAFLSSLKRMAIYANKTTHQIKLNMTESELQILAEDFDFSNEASERLACEYEGESLEIGFNARFLVEMLSNIDSEEVMMQFSESSKAGLIIPKDKEPEEDILLLIMPVILK